MTPISDRQFIIILVIYMIAYKLLTIVTQSEIDIIRENRKSFSSRVKKNTYSKIKDILIFLYSIIALILNVTARILMLSSFIKICYIFIKQK